MSKNLFVLAIGCLVASSAYATPVTYSGTIKTFADNGDAPAHVIQMGSNISSACDLSGNVSRAYILPDEKELFATALSAAALGSSVVVSVEPSSTSLTIPNTLPSPLTCRVLQILIY